MRVTRWLSVLPIVFFLQVNTCGQVNPEPLEPGQLTVEVVDGQEASLSAAAIFIDGVEQDSGPPADFELEALVSYEVSVYLEGWTFSPESRTVMLAPGQQHIETFTGTQEIAELTVQAVDLFGEPVEGPVLLVNGVEQDPALPGVYTVGAGLELTLSLDFGRWAFEPAETTVVLSPDSEVELTFRGMDLERIILIEDFTNSSCIGCPLADAAVWGAVESATGTAVPVAWHLYWPDNRDPFYLYNPIPIQMRHVDYGGFGPLPAIFVEGQAIATASDQAEILAAIEAGLAQDRRVAMKLAGAWDGGTWNLQLDGVVNEDPGAGPWRAYIIVYETEVEWTGGNLDEWRHPFRHINGETGETLGEAVTLTAGEGFTVSASFTPDAGQTIAENLRAIAFIQHDGSREILDAVLESTGGP